MSHPIPYSKATIVLDPYKEQFVSWLTTDSHRSKRDRRTAKLLFQLLQAQGYYHQRRIRFLSTIELANTLEPEKASGKQGQLAYRLMQVGLVILDELGYLPFSHRRAVLCCSICYQNGTSVPA